MKRDWILGLVLALVLTAVGAPVSGKHYSEWSAATKITENGINTDASESCPAISRDGLSLYIASNRPSTVSSQTDLYVCQRANVDDPWGAPQPLGANINTTTETERCPYVTPDGRRLIFVRQNPAVVPPGGSFVDDFYMSTRRDKKDDFGWGDPVKIGALGSTGMETAGWGFEDEDGDLTFYFGSTRNGQMDIYESTMDSDGSWTAPVNVSELNDSGTSAMDYGPVVRKDGLELYLTSTRAGEGAQGGWDIWVSTRNSTSETWSTPRNLGPDINTSANEWRFSMTGDGMNVVFASNRDTPSPFFMNLYTTQRTKVTGSKK